MAKQKMLTEIVLGEFLIEIFSHKLFFFNLAIRNDILYSKVLISGKRFP